MICIYIKCIYILIKYVYKLNIKCFNHIYYILLIILTDYNIIHIIVNILLTYTIIVIQTYNNYKIPI